MAKIKLAMIEKVSLNRTRDEIIIKRMFTRNSLRNIFKKNENERSSRINTYQRLIYDQRPICEQWPICEHGRYKTVRRVRLKELKKV